MRSVCVPLVGNVTVVACDSQYAAFCHPQLFRLAAVLSVARFTSRPAVELIGEIAAPFACASENWSHTESLYFELASAFSRSQTVYGVPAFAVKVTST